MTGAAFGILAVFLSASAAASLGRAVVSERLRYRAELPRGWVSGRGGRELRPAVRRGGVAPGGVDVAFETSHEPDPDGYLRSKAKAPRWVRARKARFTASRIKRRGFWRMVEVRAEEKGKPALSIVHAVLPARGGFYTVDFWGEAPWFSENRKAFDRFLDSFERTKAVLRFKDHRDAKRRFRMQVPESPWKISYSKVEDRLRVWGPPGPGNGTLALVSVQVHIKGGKFEDAAAFLRSQAERVGGRKPGRIVTRKYPGGTAKLFETRSSVDTKDMPHIGGRVRFEETSATAVFERGNRFVVVEYSAPASIYADYLPAFNRALKSFRFSR